MGPGGLLRTIRGWGATDAELREPLACDPLVPGGRVLVRAVDVDAPPALVFRWLCQLRAAPYSSDAVDHLGRRSPQELVDGLEALEAGQPFMTIFALRSFTPGVSLTLESRGPLGHVGVTYLVRPREGGARLRCRIRWRPPLGRLTDAWLGPALGAGDLVMSRRQLLNLKVLAERDAAAGVVADAP